MNRRQFSPSFKKFNSRLFQKMEILGPVEQVKFQNPLPRPERVFLDKCHKGKAGKDGVTVLEMRDTTQWLGLVSKNDDSPVYTPVWGYKSPESDNITYPGPTLVAESNKAVNIRWENHLPESFLVPVDYSIHIARPSKSGVPTVSHLHGGHTESESDGLPEAWFTRDFRELGPDVYKKIYHYDNDQEGGATLWYHDHALGVTRINVYSGLAGFYLLRDSNERHLIRSGVLPCETCHEIEMVVQDRDFTPYGQLFLPFDSEDLPPDAPIPSVLPEFFGNYILVNGMTWPHLKVDPTKYRFRLLNGSDSRFYVFRLDYGMNFLQIGTDQGFLKRPVRLEKLTLGPGQRADVIIDFEHFGHHHHKDKDHKCMAHKGGHGPHEEKKRVRLLNVGPDEPFRGFNSDGSLSDGQGGELAPANPETTGLIMEFRIRKKKRCPEHTACIGEKSHHKLRCAPLLPPLKAPKACHRRTRQLVLFEGEDQYGRLRPQLGTLDEGSLLWDEPVTEVIRKGATELWEIFNATVDAHPIHLHLVHFRVKNRQAFVGEVQVIGTAPLVGTKQKLFVESLLEPVIKAPPEEKGPMDTVIMLPGQVTRIVATFDRDGLYVWHCHILSHEDHEMMRPFKVVKK